MSRTTDHNGLTNEELDIQESDLALDPDGMLDEPVQHDDPADLERLEREALQRPDPTEDDLPDRAYDRIVPGV